MNSTKNYKKLPESYILGNFFIVFVMIQTKKGDVNYDKEKNI